MICSWIGWFGCFYSDEYGKSYINRINPKTVITVPADVQAPNGARPSADTMLMTKLDMFFFRPKFLLM